MLGRSYEGQACPIARSLGEVGERWSLLIVRDLLFGAHRFDELQASLGVARNVLAARLARLAECGIVERRLYRQRPERFEYHLTPKGRELVPVLVALGAWGDRHLPGEGGADVVHDGCGGRVDAALRCERCGERVPVDAVAAIVRA